MTPAPVMDHVVANVPLGQVRYEALMERHDQGDYRPLGEPEIMAINEGLIVGCLAVLHRQDLEDMEYAALAGPWNTILEFPAGCAPEY